MTTEEKIKDITLYVESFLQRFGFTAVGNIQVNASFKLTNKN